MFGSLATLVAVAGLAASPPPGLGIAGAPPDRTGWVTAVEPKPLSENVRRGLKWLAEHQHENGGWSQGEESQAMRGRGDLTARPDVGDTAAATLALIRSGSTPSAGPYAGVIRKALGFIMGHIEKSDYKSISVTDVKGTRLQAKLGPNIDTFLASLVLSEAVGHLPDEESENRVAAALDKVIYKIQENQQGDGMWGMQGWAPALADAMAAKSLNRAKQAGAAVDGGSLQLAQSYVAGEVAAGRAAAGKGSAGVALYAGARNLGILQDSVNTNRQRRAELVEQARSDEDPELRDQARAELVRIDLAEAAYDGAQKAIIERLDDEQFIAGFGSNGGEEFLSHMNIGESLVVKGGQDWKKWDAEMTANMNRIQNQDGSWTGHHCITGKTFCTATALMVLMVDRTPVPPEALAEPGDAETPKPPKPSSVEE
jgi:hypothetical protein